MRGPVGSVAGRSGVVGTLLPSFSFWMARASDLLGLSQWVCSRSAASVQSPTKDLSVGLQLAYETTSLVS